MGKTVVDGLIFLWLLSLVAHIPSLSCKAKGKYYPTGALFTPVQIYNFSMLMGVFFVKNCKHG
jgi:hypothetical protein